MDVDEKRDVEADPDGGFDNKHLLEWGVSRLRASTEEQKER